MIEEANLRNYLKDHTNAEAADYFGVSLRTLIRVLKKYNLTYEILKYGDFPEISMDQMDLIDGCLLGDGHLEKRRFRFGQAFHRKEYVEWVNLSLQPYTQPSYTESTTLRGKIFLSERFYTINHSRFEELRHRWYDGKTKIIPTDLSLNEQKFVHWFMQDGHHRPKKRSYNISTNCFSVSEVEYLIFALQRDLLIKGTLNFQKEKPKIHIGSYEYDKVADILQRRVIWDCFSYKSNNDSAPKKTNKGAYKINFQIAEDIRRDRRKGSTVKQLSLQYQVCIQSIYNVINNVSYKPKETALVNVIYNPEIT